MQKFILIVLAWFVTPPLHASGPIAYDASLFHADQASFAMLVAGASDQQPYMTAGHLMLRVKENSADYVFDWGVFDDTREGFFGDYVFGKLDYEHIVRPFPSVVRGYVHENRRVMEYPLVLTIKQKQRLIDGITNWAKPENRVYAYNIVSRNCSTVLGGLIVDAVGPKLASKMSESSQISIRQIGLTYLAHFPPIEIFADIIGGPVSDQPVPIRDLFYLPILVPEFLAQAHAYDDDGNELDLLLLGTPNQILDGDNVGPLPSHGTSYFGVILFAVAVGCLTVRPRMPRLWTVYASAFFTFSTLCGSIIFFLSFFSLHSFSYGNRHLFFFWPVDIIAIGLLVKRDWNKYLKVYAGVHLVAALAVTIYSFTVATLSQDLGAGWKLSVPTWTLVLLSLTWKSFATTGDSNNRFPSRG